VTGSGHVRFVVGKSGTGAGFLPVLRLPLPIISQTAPQSSSLSSSIIQSWYNRPNIAQQTGDLTLAPPKETKNKLKIYMLK
jgi:hypothetical protein